METSHLEKKSENIEIEDWGLIDYAVANQRQLELVEIIHSNDLPGRIVFCTHPEIVTLGRSTEQGDVFSWDGPVAEISRGGRATYHGPSQLVIYPIINLKYSSRAESEQQNVVGHLRKLENSIMYWLQTLNIQAEGKTLDPQNRRPQFDYKGQRLEETGVWVNGKKIASLGIAVKKWVTYHGAAINVFSDDRAFRGLHPCGFSQSVMTNLETVLNRKIDLEKESKALGQILLSNI